MEIAEKLSALAAKIRQQRGAIQTEEATKNAMVMPFLQVLGYNIFDPTEVIPEYTADIGIKKGDKILIVDDLVATGGTAKAKAELVEKMGGEVVGFCFLIELEFLNPRKVLKDYDIFSLIKYESE